MNTGSHRFRRTAFVCCLLLISQQILFVPLLAAQDGLGVVPPTDGLPSGGNVVAGSASIQQAVNGLNIQSLSDKTIINWNNFSVGSGNSVNFNQPGVNSAVLNRVITSNPSAIYGAINSNGNVLLVNPNGILVGPSGVINTNGFTASVLDISNSDFLAGGDLSFSGNSNASVVNAGSIFTGSGGVHLLGNTVINSGLIESSGNINLVTGGTVNLKNGVTYTQADQSTIQNGISETSGMIQNSGTIRATGSMEVGGEVYLVAPGGKVFNEGMIAASKNDVGGKVVATGNEVEFKGATVDVSGDNGGGEVYVGGGFQGNNEAILNAATTTIDENTSINADALANGDGGTVVVWSDESTDFSGSITARGGSESGNGGLVEVSGMALAFSGFADTSAVNGDTGWLLLDPAGIRVIRNNGNVIVVNSSGGSFVTVTDTALNYLLASSNVLLATTPTDAVVEASSLYGPWVGANDDNIQVEAGTIINTGSNTLYLSTTTLDLSAPIMGNVSGGSSSPLTPAGITLKDPTTVNVFDGGSIQNAMDVIGTGGQVNIGAGTFDSFIVNQSGLTLSGAGASTIVQTSSPAITVNANGTTVMNMNLVGTGAAGDIGILLDGTAAPNLTGITIDNVSIDMMEDGIVSQGTIGIGGASDVLIDGVTITNTFNDGIRFNSTSTAVVEILNSNIGTSGSRIGGHGINLEGMVGGTADFTLDGNNVFAADKAVNVLNLSSGAVLDIAGGTYDGTNGGLMVRNTLANVIVPLPAGDLELSNSTFVGGTGSTVVDLSHDSITTTGFPFFFPLFRPGVGVTVSSGVTINGGATGLRFSGPRMDIVGDTLSDLTFNGQTGNYIELDDFAELLPGAPTIIDASGTTFDGVAAVDLTADQFFDVEGKLDHFPDSSLTGLIDLGPLFVVQGESIQLAVNAAGGMAGPQTVAVANGVYGGSVELWVDDLTITGQGPGTVIDANAVDAFANNGDVNVGFEVTNRPGGGNGVGDVTGVTIEGFGFTSFSLFPSQINTGISLGTPAGAAIDTTIQDSTFTNLQAGIRGRFVEGTTTIQNVNMVPLLFSPTVNQGIRFANDLNNVTINIDNANIIADVNAVRFAGQVNGSDVNITGSNLVSTGADSVVFVDTIDGSQVDISGSVVLGNDDGINLDEILGSDITIENNTSIIGQNGSGIEFDNSISGGSNIQVNGNQFISGAEEGVEFDASITGSLVGIANNTGISAGLDAIQFKEAITLSLISISDNALINSLGGDGISFEDQFNVSLMFIGNNGLINSLGGDGVNFEDSVNAAGILLFNNNIASTGGDGIAFQDEVNVSAIGLVANRVAAGGEGIQFFDDINLSLIGILGNITATDGTGIAFSDRSNALDTVINDSLVLVAGNTIGGPIFPAILTPDFGIQFEGIDGSSTVTVTNNNVLEAGQSGLHVENFVSGDALLDINNNTFGSVASRMGAQGIDIELVDSSRGVQIVDNTVFANGNAIEFDNDLSNTIVNIEGNSLNALILDGIQVEGGILGTTQFTVLNNQISAGRHGVGMLNTSSIQDNAIVEICQNDILMTGLVGTGILLRNIGSSETVTVDNNTTTGGRFGIQLIQSAGTGANGDVVVKFNEINAALEAGIRVINQNAVDALNVSLSESNVVNGGGVTQTGLFFSGQNLSLTGDTLGNFEFLNMPGNFIVLESGALFEPGQPTVIDATGVNFDGIDSNTVAGFNEIESRIIHFIDNPTLGLFWPGFQPLTDALVYDQFERHSDYVETLQALFGGGFEGTITFGASASEPNSDEVIDGSIRLQQENSFNVFGN